MLMLVDRPTTLAAQVPHLQPDHRQHRHQRRLVRCVLMAQDVQKVRWFTNLRYPTRVINSKNGQKSQFQIGIADAQICWSLVNFMIYNLHPIKIKPLLLVDFGIIGNVSVARLTAVVSIYSATHCRLQVQRIENHAHARN